MNQGDLNRAQLWLHRADTIYSADDGVYEKVGDKLVDDCSDRIGQLEDEEQLLYNGVPADIDERAEELGDVQIRVWGLMSAARRADAEWCAGAVKMCQALDRRMKSQRGVDSGEELKLLLARLGASRR